jgi:hypothetical protein
VHTPDIALIWPPSLTTMASIEPAFNTVDRRLIRPGGVPLIGFIY